MLYVRKHRLDTVEQLHKALLTAIQLELATLPPYLTALYSIKPGMNVEIAAILRHVAMQEMLHFCLVGNVLNAIGGQCQVTAAEFVPRYPGPLPMNIGTKPDKPFIVPLRKLSIELIRDIFMTIEEPEDPNRYANEHTPVPKTPQHHTIGEFYDALAAAVAAHGRSIFTGDPKWQVTGWFAKDELFAVTDPKSAARAFEIIKEQGEGAGDMPTDDRHKLAHYYLFAEIANGRRLVRNSKHPKGWSFTGAKIPFDPAGVYPMVDDPGEVKLPDSSPAGMFADRFDATFSTLLNALHVTFNGHPHHFESAVGVMYTLRIIAQQLMALPIPGRTTTAGPRWRYVASTSVA